MKTLEKVLNWVEWISAALGVVLILLGTFSLVLRWNVFPVNEAYNYFHVANSFFLLAIVLFLATHFGHFKKE